MHFTKTKTLYILCRLILGYLFTTGFLSTEAQSVSGPTCVVGGGNYEYTVAGFTGQLCVTGGVIVHFTNCMTNATPTIRVIWNTGITSGSIALTGYPSATLNVSVAPALQGGSPSNPTQNINYNTTPATISCSVATFGSCTPTYVYQWQLSTDAVSYTNISGATSQNLSFSSPITVTTYYRRMVTETVSSTSAYSSVATAFVYPQLQGGSASPSSQTIMPGTNASPLSLTGVTGGSGSYSYQWQSSSDNSTWTNIAGATQNNYTPLSVASATYYRAVITSNGVSANSASAFVNLYPALVAGTISPGSQTINYNSNASNLTLSGVSGGSGTYSYQWQSSTDNSNWSNVGSTSTSYTPGALQATRYFRVAVTSAGTTKFSSTATVSVNPQVFPGTISQPIIQVVSGTSPGGIIVTNATGGNCGSFVYQWQSSSNGTTFSNIAGATAKNYVPGVITATTWYRRQVTCGTDIEYSDTCEALLVSGSMDMNFTRVRTFLKAGVLDTVTASGLTNTTDVMQTTEYLDGFGRPTQVVNKKANPDQNDLISTILFDGFGRQSQQNLPYAASANDGSYRPAALSEGYNFNATQFTGEQYYFSEVDYEQSPLNRPLNTFAPGVSWVGSNKGISTQYLVNEVSDSVQIWNIKSAQGSLPINGGRYQNGQLRKLISVDENGHEKIEYRDKLGKVVLKKIQLANSPGSAHVGWLSTYYVYDTLQNMRFIIQPKAVNLINSSWTLTQLIADELCFRFEYDERRRVIIKKNPGAAEVWTIYDARDRAVMIQDSSMRVNHKWMFVKYDALNRPDSTGTITDPTNYNHLSYHQGLASTSTNYPQVSSYTFELLTRSFYDDYAWITSTSAPVSSTIATTYTTNSTDFITGYNTAPTYSVAVTQFNITRGLATGTMTKVLGTSSQFLYTVNFYDDRGRVIQKQSSNYTGAIDTITMQYNFKGVLLRTLLNHKKNGTSAQSHTILTKMDYDHAFRLKHVWKNIDNAGTDQLIDSLQYNSLGQLKRKFVGGVDSLIYDYNIRGWLTGINKNFIAGSTTNYFGIELAYDKTSSVSTTTYSSTELNGTVAGTIWKSSGDGIARKYDYTYDNVNQLTTANFVQNTSGTTWDNGYIDFSARNISYDANGNITNMSQKGFKVGGSSVIDSLSYGYQTSSNKLSVVNDVSNDANSKLGDFHYTGTKGSSDYSYDGNGNIISDNNKGVSSITYNYLNLPQQVTITSKGNIQFIYDANGNRLQKTITDNTISPAKTTTTTYVAGFVYQAVSPPSGGAVGPDTLQFVVHEEGRIRWAFHKYTTGSVGYGFEYDFFEKDHLGNTRVVLTKQKDTAQYIATMEAAYRSTESKLFYNLQASNYPRASVSGYPSDPTTNPNDSIMKLNGSGQKIGAAIVLKVMSGDIVDIAVKSYYTTQTGSGTSPSLTDVLASLANGVVTLASGAKGSLTDLNNTTTSPLFSALNSFTAANNPTIASKPRAYLNWILLDDQLKYVSSYPQSGAVAVGNTSAGTLNTIGYTGIPITKNGYLYIYVNNETQGWDVFFDNLSVKHRAGPLLEESHFYPFGLSMAAISSKSVKTNYTENKYRYNNGTELDNADFSDGSGLEIYETAFRGYDPQIGRFGQLDPMAKSTDFASPYAYCLNNPVAFIDPLGLRLLTPQEFQQLLNSENGGSWNEGSGVTLYQSQDETFMAATMQMGQLGLYGAEEGFAGSFEDALRRYNGGTVTSDMAAQFYRATWGSEASNISTTDAENGFNLSYTATSSGKSYTEFVTAASIIESLDFLAELYSGEDKLGKGLKKANELDGAFSIGWGAKENLINYAAKFDASIEELSYVRGVKIGSRGLFGAQIIISGLQTYHAFHNHDANRWGVAGKAGVDVLMAAVGTFGGPAGWVVSGVYFLGDSFGWWGDWGEEEESKK
ncbi:MAG: DUF6443 domain-containing protein [Agriterribacter sp.]